MSKIARDLGALPAAVATRGFWLDLAFVMFLPIVCTLLFFWAKSPRDIAIVTVVCLVALAWSIWYALSQGYIPYKLGAPRRFVVSEVIRPGPYYVYGFLDGEPRRYRLVSPWRLAVARGDALTVLKHPYRNSIVWISRRSAARHGETDRLEALPGGRMPVFYEDLHR